MKAPILTAPPEAPKLTQLAAHGFFLCRCCNLPPGVTTLDTDGPDERGTYRVTLKCTVDVFAADAGEACELAEQQLPPDAGNVTSEAELTD